MRFSSLPKMLFAVHHHLVNYPTPPNISYAWSFGGLALVVMAIQITTGVFLTMHYTPDTEISFSSVEQHVMRDVNSGWVARYLHANGASFIFLLMYWHMGRTMYFKAYNPPRQLLWVSGVITFLLLMATGFLGYVLPWGQMSFWGATVITNLFSAIPIVGPYIAYWLWGGFSVGKATLVKFFTLHYLLPFVVIGILMVHISFLHEGGSTESVQEEAADTWEFGTYFAIKDTLVFLVYLVVACCFVYYAPNLLGHPDNAIMANPLVTPLHIVPEWYFLPFYAILKCVPNKRLGVLMMIWSIIYLLFYGDADPNWNILLTRYTPSYYWYRSIFWLFVVNFLVLGAIGALPAQAPYTEVGRFATWLYFFLMVIYAQPTPTRYVLAVTNYVDEVYRELYFSGSNEDAAQRVSIEKNELANNNTVGDLYQLFAAGTTASEMTTSDDNSGCFEESTEDNFASGVVDLGVRCVREDGEVFYCPRRIYGRLDLKLEDDDDDERCDFFPRNEIEFVFNSPEDFYFLFSSKNSRKMAELEAVASGVKSKSTVIYHIFTFNELLAFFDTDPTVILMISNCLPVDTQWKLPPEAYKIKFSQCSWFFINTADTFPVVNDFFDCVDSTLIYDLRFGWLVVDAADVDLLLEDFVDDEMALDSDLFNLYLY